MKNCLSAGYIFVKTAHPSYISKIAKKLDLKISFCKPVKKFEIDKLREKDGCNSEQKHSYSIGDSVYICNGAFNHQRGIIEEIDSTSESRQLKVVISVFGREIPVKLSFSEVKKVEV